MTKDWRPESPILTLHRDDQGRETVTVDRWPRQIEVDEPFITSSRPDFLQVDGDTLTFTVANGRAVYQLVDLSATRMTHRAVLVSCMVQQEVAP